MTESFAARDIVVALAIVLPVLLVAGAFRYGLRRAIRRLVAKTTTVLDDMLVESLEWPVFAGIVLVGMYFAAIYLPLETSIDFQVKRGFHIAFILLAAYAGAAAADSLLRWFKLEVASKTQTALDDWIVNLLRWFTPLVAGFIALLASLQEFGIRAQGLKDWLLVHGTRIGLIVFLSVVLIFVLGVAGSKAIRSFVARSSVGQPEDEIEKRASTLTGVLTTAGQVFIIVIAGFVILSELGINIAPVLAGAGVVGVAIGFGAQSLVKDIIAGMFIVMENQYRVGDVVKIADISGLVEQVNLRRTVLRDLDGIVHVVPNGEIRVASNYTKEWSRVNLNISVAYGTDLDHAISVINRVCAEMAREPEWASAILKTPQVLRVDNLGDSGIEIKILGDTKPIRQWDVMGEIRKRVKQAFDKEDIEIPWPHTKVFFGDFPSGMAPNPQPRPRADAAE